MSLRIGSIVTDGSVKGLVIGQVGDKVEVYWFNAGLSHYDASKGALPATEQYTTVLTDTVYEVEAVSQATVDAQKAAEQKNLQAAEPAPKPEPEHESMLDSLREAMPHHRAEPKEKRRR